MRDAACQIQFLAVILFACLFASLLCLCNERMLAVRSYEAEDSQQYTEYAQISYITDQKVSAANSEIVFIKRMSH